MRNRTYGRAALSSLAFLTPLRLVRRYAKACGRVVSFVVVKGVRVVRKGVSVVTSLLVPPLLALLPLIFFVVIRPDFK